MYQKKALGKYEFVFPETPEEAKTWKEDGYVKVHRVPARRVMAVAHTRIEGAWCAYIDAVPGMNHDNEWQEVLKTGDKLSEKVALAMFPMFEGIPYAQ